MSQPFLIVPRSILPLVSTIVLLAQIAPAQAAAARKGKERSAVQHQFLNPAGLSKPTGYTHVVTAQPGRMVFVAGQVALNAKGEVVGKGDLRAQTVQVFENLKTALAAAGATFDDVVKLNYYVVNMQPEHPAIIREARAKYLSPEHPPAGTLVGVTALAREEFLVEIEAVAVVQ